MNRKKPNTKRGKNGMYPFILVLVSFSFLLTTVNVVLLCVICPRKDVFLDGLYFDYSGVIVAIFSLLVTILIGWNIYSVLDIKQISQEVEKISQQYDDRINDIQDLLKRVPEIENNNSLIVEQYILNIYLRLSGKDNSSVDFHVLEVGLGVIDAFIKTNRIDNATTTTSLLVTVIDTGVSINSDEKEKLFTKLSRINNADKIQNFNSLIEHIAMIKTNE